MQHLADYTPAPPPASLVQCYDDRKPIAFAEMAGTLAEAFLWFMRSLDQPTTITVYTDSSSVYHSLVRGPRLTLRTFEILKNLYAVMIINKQKSGHGLVVSWVPSAENMADPLSRGVLAPPNRVRQ
jgi:hypothetical protein